MHYLTSHQILFILASLVVWLVLGLAQAFTDIYANKLRDKIRNRQSPKRPNQ